MHRASLLALLLATVPAAASDQALYARLSGLTMLQDTYKAERTPTGIDFVSKSTIPTPDGEQHPKYHVEVEGALPAHGLNSLEAAAKVVAGSIRSEVDASRPQENPIAPGINVDFVDINGVVVAILSYRSSMEDRPFRQRAVMLAGDHLYVATMSWHTALEKDPAAMTLMLVVIDMVNSGEIDGLRT